MSRFRFYIFPRLCLALSALVLLGGLWVLWLSMGRPMPTQGLACRQAETARFLPHGTTSASGPLRYENGVWFGKADAWAVRRAGDSFTLMELERTAGLLWRSEAIMDITPSRWGEAIWAFPAGLDYYDVFQEGSLDSETWSEFTPVAVSDDPRVAQVEVTAVWVGDEERDAPAAALAERGVPPGSPPPGTECGPAPPCPYGFIPPGLPPAALSSCSPVGATTPTANLWPSATSPFLRRHILPVYGMLYPKEDMP